MTWVIVGSHAIEKQDILALSRLLLRLSETYEAARDNRFQVDMAKWLGETDVVDTLGLAGSRVSSREKLTRPQGTHAALRKIVASYFCLNVALSLCFAVCAVEASQCQCR